VKRLRVPGWFDYERSYQSQAEEKIWVEEVCSKAGML
jgi:hypothetical protein